MKIADRTGPSFWVCVLLFTQLCLDGYDITVLSFTAPLIAKAWGVADPHAMGVVFSAGLFGMLVGSVVGGVAADRFGPKRVLVSSTIVVGLFTLAVTIAESLPQLLVLRAAAGLGLGAALPSVVRILLRGATSEKRGSQFVLVCLGVNIGAAAPGLFIATLLPVVGWRGLFAIGGVLPAILAIALIIWLPRDTTTDVDAAPRARQPLSQLFAGRLGVLTPVLWTLFFCNSAVLYAIVSWAPTLATKAGMSIQAAGMASSALQVGGLLSGAAIGLSRAKLNLGALAAMLAAACLCIAALGLTIGHDLAYAANLFLLGGALFGALFTLNFLAGWFYPAAIRGTASGIAGAFGRVGALTGPIAGVLLMAAGASPATFVLAASPLLFAAGLSVWGARAARRRSQLAPDGVS